MIASILGPTDLAAVFAVCGVVVMFLRSRTKNLTVSMGKLHATLDTVSEQVKAVDAAVNDRLPGVTTISDDVTSAKESLTGLQEFIAYQHVTNHRLVNMLGAHNGLMPIFLERLDSIQAQLKETS